MDDIKWPPRPFRAKDKNDNTEQPVEREVAVQPEPPAEDIAYQTSDTATPTENPDPKKSRFKLPAFIRKPRNKKQWALLAAIVVLLFGGSAAAFTLTRKKPAPPPVVQKEEPKPEPPPPPTTEASRLSGIEVPIELNKRPVTAVMIENSPDARPQAGLKDAGVVFEAIAEGGITRFVALFQTEQPDYIGPVRSVRPYYLDWILPFDASLAHAGGSPQGLADVRSLGVKDLDHGANGGAFQRVSSRFAPHNLYTSTAALDGLNQAKGFTASTFTGFVRKPFKPTQPAPAPAPAPAASPATPAAPPPAPTAVNLDFAMSSFLYNPKFTYDQASNTYKRSEGGKPHVDERSGAQIAPSVVIALVIPRSQNGIYSVYQTAGSGKMYLFQDGGVVEGTWTKADRKAQYTFTGADSKPLELNPGQTWLTAVANAGMVSAKP